MIMDGYNLCRHFVLKNTNLRSSPFCYTSEIINDVKHDLSILSMRSYFLRKSSRPSTLLDEREKKTLVMNFILHNYNYFFLPLQATSLDLNNGNKTKIWERRMKSNTA